MIVRLLIIELEAMDIKAQIALDDLYSCNVISLFALNICTRVCNKLNICVSDIHYLFYVAITL